MKRYKVVIEDVFIDREVIIVEARNRSEAQERADELVTEGQPVESYRRFEVSLEEEDDEHYDDVLLEE